MERQADMLRDARLYLIGWCDGNNDLCDAIWSVLLGDVSVAKAARDAGMERTKLGRKVEQVRSSPVFQKIVKEAHDGEASEPVSAR